MSEWPWAMTATMVAALALIFVLLVVGLTIHVGFVAPKRQRARRHERLKHPADVSFVVPPRSSRAVDFAVQDDDEHRVKELVLQSHAEYVVELLIRPRLHFRSARTLFGCDGGPGPEDRPCPLEFRNPLVLRGTGRTGVPDRDHGHDITLDLQYQRDESREWTVGTAVIHGYLLKTGGPGSFPAKFRFSGGQVEGVADDLVVRVEDKAPLKMSCVVKEHRGHSIRPVFTRS